LRLFPHREVIPRKRHFLRKVEQQLADAVQLTRLLERQRPEQDCIHDAEHGRRAGDSERDRERG
jgi:hypothetical protein